MTSSLDRRFLVTAHAGKHETARDEFDGALAAEQRAAELRSKGWRVSVTDRAQRVHRSTPQSAVGEPVTIGWRVLVDGVPSRRYSVHAAAEECAQLARASGRAAVIEAVHGRDGAGGLL